VYQSLCGNSQFIPVLGWPRKQPGRSRRFDAHIPIDPRSLGTETG
jgi:hypothetical protein